MPRKCAVIGCDTNREYYEPGVRFFTFPAVGNYEARERWRELIGRDADWAIPKLASVCQRHFTASELPPGYKLDEAVLPSMNLPPRRMEMECLKVEPVVDEDEEFQSVEEKEVERKLRKPSKRRKNRQVLKREVDQERLQTNCRLCAAEISTDDGLSVEELKSQERVCDNIWEICLLDSENSSFEKHYSLICNECWQQLVAFEDFAVNCTNQQKSLLEEFDNLKTIVNSQEYEEAALPADTVTEIEKVPLEIDPDEMSSEPPEDEDQTLPSLEGLSIEQMIETPEKIPQRTKKRGDSTIDQECWDCGKVFESRWLKKKHRKTCTAIGTPESLRNKTYICEVCKKQIRTRAGYRLHLVKIHRNEILAGQLECPDELSKVLSRKHLKCPLCTKPFQQVHQLKYHLKTHLNKQLAGVPERKESQGPATCEVCGKTFEYAPYLTQHMKFHLKIKDHGCDQCGKRFYTYPDLVLHQKSLHQEHTFLCGVCGKSYGAKKVLDRHIRLKHDETTLKYGCSYCDKRFVSSKLQKYHEMTHTGERNHSCELCGHAFRFRYALTQHKIKVHNIQIEGVKLYKQYRRKEDGVDGGKADEEDTGQDFEHVEYLL